MRISLPTLVLGLLFAAAAMASERPMPPGLEDRWIHTRPILGECGALMARERTLSPVVFAVNRNPLAVLESFQETWDIRRLFVSFAPGNLPRGPVQIVGADSDGRQFHLMTLELYERPWLISFTGAPGNFPITDRRDPRANFPWLAASWLMSQLPATANEAEIYFHDPQMLAPFVVTLAYRPSTEIVLRDLTERYLTDEVFRTETDGRVVDEMRAIDETTAVAYRRRLLALRRFIAIDNRSARSNPDAFGYLSRIAPHGYRSTSGAPVISFTLHFRRTPVTTPEVALQHTETFDRVLLEDGRIRRRRVSAPPI